jgi:FkbM family methyltransferase
VRALWWRVHCLLCWPATVRVPAWEARVCLPPEWHGAGATLFAVAREDYEPELRWLGRFVASGDVFVDAGANCGVYTAAAAHFTGAKGRVLAFEPGPQICAFLRRTVALNRWPHVTVRQEALSDRCELLRLYGHEHGASSFTLGASVAGATESVVIQSLTLDSVCAELGIPEINVIKMDVEGAEELILRGAKKIFAQTRLPKVIFEINPEACARLDLRPDGAWAFLAALGYAFHVVSPGGEVRKISEPLPSGNVVALPPH